MTNLLCVAKHYHLKKKLGSGAFGVVYRAVDVRDNKEYAVKLELKKCKYPQLNYEYKLYNYLHSKAKSLDIGLPKVKHFT